MLLLIATPLNSSGWSVLRNLTSDRIRVVARMVRDQSSLLKRRRALVCGHWPKPPLVTEARSRHARLVHCFGYRTRSTRAKSADGLRHYDRCKCGSNPRVELCRLRNSSLAGNCTPAVTEITDDRCSGVSGNVRKHAKKISAGHEDMRA